MKARSKLMATLDSVRELEDLPNIGKEIAGDFRLLGIKKPKDLIGQDPYFLYRKLEALTSSYQDPCVLDTFISACRFMAGEPAKPWWAYTAERKKDWAKKVGRPT